MGPMGYVPPTLENLVTKYVCSSLAVVIYLRVKLSATKTKVKYIYPNKVMSDTFCCNHFTLR